MKSKFLVLIILIIALSAIVYFMIKIENRYLTSRNMPIRVTYGIDTSRSDERESVTDLSDGEWINQIKKVKLVCKAFGENITFAKTIRGQRLTDNKSVFEPRFLKGVNFGVATPGSYPGEFAASQEQYYQWLIDIGKMKANVIRVYTILPPVFYSTFAKYNSEHSENPLWLLQGIWTEPPPTGDYLDKDFMAGFNREVRDAVDVIFGRAVIPQRPGQASGKYVVDISSHTLGFILGREWEPQGVTLTNMAHRDINNYKGRFFVMPEGNQIEIFLASSMDYLMAYETSAYGYQHPVSFVNWLPLDPMYHNSEWLEGDKISEFDNDLESINPMHIYTTPNNKAGYFASYHVYPYYPDFIYNDSLYRAANCSNGPCTYYGYIEDLKKHHKGLPLVIAEYGVPSSRSTSHSMPSGMNQGKHTENEQGQINAHLTQDIYDTGCAGALLFSWIDEWFKHNWMVMELEIPTDRNRLWHNLEDPEQFFGIAALEDCRIKIDGDQSDWGEGQLYKDKLADIESGQSGMYDLKSLEAISDATCLYLKINFNSPFPVSDTGAWEKLGILVAIDTYDKEKGDHYISRVAENLEDGAEFLLDIRGPGQTSLLVDNAYDVCNEYPISKKPLYRSVNNSDGIFNTQKMIPNRRRFSLTGEEFPKVISYRGEMRWASMQIRPEGDRTLDDIAFCDHGQAIELRIPWALLNVTDPSSLSVLDDNPKTDNIDYTATEGFHFYLFTYNPSSKKPAAIDKFPDYSSADGLEYRWKGWEKPQYTYRLKYGYNLMAETFNKIDAPAGAKPEIANHIKSAQARLTRWPENKKGAITITFDDASYGQYKYGFPIVRKYQQGGTYFILTGWVGNEGQITGEKDEIQTLRLSWPQLREMAANGFEIGTHGFLHRPLDNRVTDAWIKETFTKSKKLIEEEIGQPCVSISYPYSVITEPRMRAMTEMGFQYGRRGGSIPNEYEISNYMSLYSYPIIDTSRPHFAELYRELQSNTDKWTIMLFHHIFPENATEWKIFASHNVKDSYSLTPLDFERYIRLIRNENMAAGSVRQIGDYHKIVKTTKLDFSIFENYYTINLNNPDFKKAADINLAIELFTPWRYVQVDGSSSDGVYENRGGEIILKAPPGATIIVRKLESEE
jgi:peptidoglycan/xylan/chitin deacetylase (PgdA/CDA1 family)